MEAFKAGTAPGEANAPAGGDDDGQRAGAGTAAPRRQHAARCGRGTVAAWFTDSQPLRLITPPMRPEIKRAVDEIQQAIALLRRHL